MTRQFKVVLMLLFSITFLVAVTRALRAQGAHGGETAHQKWSYEVKEGLYSHNLKETLDQEGAKGWELVSLNTNVEQSGSQISFLPQGATFQQAKGAVATTKVASAYYTAVFKRPE